jgi:hypothetical protein
METNKILESIIDVLNIRVKEINYQGDESDLGNEIGFAIGQIIKNMNNNQINDLIMGLKHGISLTNNTH